jgi:SAM-dependent methyltransferase
MAHTRNRWPTVEHALWYLERADGIPHRTEGEGVLLDHLPERVERVLDLGTGDGRLLELVLTARPGAAGVGLDFNEHMLAAASERFAGRPEVEIRDHDLDDPLPDLGLFDAVVSSFAIHHTPDGRKRSLDHEVFARLRPGGVFLNLEHVASATDGLHAAFLRAIGEDPAHDDPSNILAPVEAQLGWLREAGFVDVDCHWKWLELALLAGVKPG